MLDSPEAKPEWHISEGPSDYSAGSISQSLHWLYSS